MNPIKQFQNEVCANIECLGEDKNLQALSRVSQEVRSNLPALSIEEAQKVSFLQKVWLTLNWLEMKVAALESAASTPHGIHSVSLATHALSGNVISGFRALEQREFGRS